MKSINLLNRNLTSTSLRHKPFASTAQRKRVMLSVVGQESAPPTTEVQTKPATLPVPVLEWKEDTEGLKELMGFAGSAPERANGRAAMIGFAAALAAELSSGLPVADQFADAAGSVILVNILLGLGTVAPKFLSGTSLAELHAAARGDNLVGNASDWTQVLKVFDTSYELWTGRVAMLGMAGLVAVEGFTGKAFF